MKFFLVLLFSAVLLPASTIEAIGGLGVGYSTPLRINDAGVVVGFAQTSAGSLHAISVAANGAVQDLNGSASESIATAVNDSGAVVGVAFQGGQAHGTIWNGTGSTDLGANSYATGINSSGQVTGGNGQAFLYSSGHMQELGTLAGGSWSSAYAINDAGSVAGYGDVAGGGMRGLLWSSAGGLTQIGTLGGNESYATAINNEGQISGSATVASGYSHAFRRLRRTTYGYRNVGRRE